MLKISSPKLFEEVETAVAFDEAVCHNPHFILHIPFPFIIFLTLSI